MAHRLKLFGLLFVVSILFIPSVLSISSGNMGQGGGGSTTNNYYNVTNVTGGNITGSGATGYVPYWTNSTNLNYDSPLFWNNTALYMLSNNNIMYDKTKFILNITQSELTNSDYDYITRNSIILVGQPGKKYTGTGSFKTPWPGNEVFIQGGNGGNTFHNDSYILTSAGGGVTIQNGFNGQNENGFGSIPYSPSSPPGIIIKTVNSISPITNSSEKNFTVVRGVATGSVSITTGNPYRSYNTTGSDAGNIYIASGIGGNIVGSATTFTAGNGGNFNIDAGTGGNGYNNTGGTGGGMIITSGTGGKGKIGGQAGQFTFSGGAGGEGYVGAGGTGSTTLYVGGSGGKGNTTPGAAGQLNLMGGTGGTGGSYNNTGGIVTIAGGAGGTGNISGSVILAQTQYGQLQGNVGIGVFTISSPNTRTTALLHQNAGNAIATYHKFTAGTTTGMLATDGFDIGISATGEAQLRQYENLNMTFWTNNVNTMTLDNLGNVTIANLAGTGNAFVCVDSTGKLYRSATACA